MTRALHIKYLLPFLIIAGAMLLSYAIVVRAEDVQSTSTVSIGGTNGIIFPIPELGNCANKDACRAYCNDPANMDACIAFAKAHGLMNADDAARAEKFRVKLQSGGGPGGCATPDACRAYCSDVSHLAECTAFAKANGIKDENVAQAEKIQSFIKSGGQMPGGCTTKESCQKYCGDFSHAQECFMFAEKAGLAQATSTAGGGAQNIQKFLSLAQNGQTPGGCASKDACETYCKDQSHRDECIAFGVKAGFINEDDASEIQRTGGKGPGGCDSAESCQAYCNDPAHQNECFTFAKEHRLIPQDELNQARSGQMNLRAGLEQAPPEVAQCLSSTIGSSTLDAIQSGNFTPGSGIGSQVKGCFEKFGHRGDPSQMFKNAPPQVLSCLKEKLGDAFAAVQSGAAPPTPEMADTLRVCFQSAQLQNGPQAMTGGAGSSTSPMMFQNFLRSAPPGVATCLQNTLGSAFQKIESGDTEGITSDAKDKVRGCLNEFRPENKNGSSTNPFGGGSGSMMPPFDAAPFDTTQGKQGKPAGATFQNMPPQMQDCLKATIGADAFTQLQQGGRPTGDISQKIAACLTQFKNDSSSQVRPMMPHYVSSSYGGERPESYSAYSTGSYPRPPAGMMQPYPAGGMMGTSSGMMYPNNYQPPSGTAYPSYPQGTSGYQPPASGTAAPPSGQYYDEQYYMNNPTAPLPPQPDTSNPPPGSFIYRQSSLGLILGPFAPILKVLP